MTGTLSRIHPLVSFALVVAVVAALVFLDPPTWLGVLLAVVVLNVLVGATVSGIQGRLPGAFSWVPGFGPQSAYVRGVMELNNGNREAALALFRKIQSACPKNPLGLTGEAQVLHFDRNFEAAIEAADRALALGESLDARLVRGQSLFQAGAAEEALADIDEAARMLRLAGPQAQGLRAQVLMDLGRSDEAAGLFEPTGPSTPGASWAVLGDAYRLLGRDDDARAAYEKAEGKLSADVASGLIRSDGPRAHVLAQLDRLEEASTLARSALEKDPTEPSALYTEALVEMKRGAGYWVTTALERMLETFPHGVVRTLDDPQFAALLTDKRFRELLQRAKDSRDRMLARIRSRKPVSE